MCVSGCHHQVFIPSINLFLLSQARTVIKTELQLVGVTAMLIASKYEEMYAPEVKDFVYITDNTYSAEQIRAMESKMLQVLDYMVGNPLPLHFLRRNSKAGEVNLCMHACVCVVAFASLFRT